MNSWIREYGTTIWHGIWPRIKADFLVKTPGQVIHWSLVVLLGPQNWIEMHKMKMKEEKFEFKWKKSIIVLTAQVRLIISALLNA